MVSINTNLSSLIVQQNLTKSTGALNQAIERLTTGCKINHASDNAANYSIANNYDSKLSSYEVASDNIAMSMDMINTAQDSIALMQSKAERLMDLWTQAQNGTYGEQSKIAIQSEANALVQEINRLYDNTEYNGIKLLGYELPDWAQEVKATAGNINSAEAHHIDDATVNGYTHVEGLSDFNGGTTFAVTTVEDLANLATLVNSGQDTTGKTFVMGADLDLSAWCAEHMDENGVGGWNAIGTDYGHLFKGTFDGNGHVITGLTVNKPTANYQGLFGYASEISTIKNVGVDCVNITGGNCVGGIVGKTMGSIEFCYSKGNVNCSGNGYCAGGLVGNSGSSIDFCYSMCTVSGYSYVGGLVGQSNCSISNSYVTGDVIGTGINSYYLGGLTGYSPHDITNSYAIVDVSGSKFAGGLVGFKEAGSTINQTLTNVASFGNVSYSEYGGNLIGGMIVADNNGNLGTVNISNSIASKSNLDFIGVAMKASHAYWGNWYGIGDAVTAADISSIQDNINITGMQTQTTLQVGINGDESSRITTNTHLSDTIRCNNIASASTYNEIQGFLDKLSARATELGAVSNRLQSAGESTVVAMENLTSSLSTIRDADVATESSNYIKAQILQQASATLLSTANLTPQLTLQLLQGLR